MNYINAHREKRMNKNYQPCQIKMPYFQGKRIRFKCNDCVCIQMVQEELVDISAHHKPEKSTNKSQELSRRRKNIDSLFSVSKAFLMLSFYM